MQSVILGWHSAQHFLSQSAKHRVGSRKQLGTPDLEMYRVTHASTECMRHTLQRSVCSLNVAIGKCQLRVGERVLWKAVPPAIASILIRMRERPRLPCVEAGPNFHTVLTKTALRCQRRLQWVFQWKGLLAADITWGHRFMRALWYHHAIASYRSCGSESERPSRVLHFY